MKFHSILAAAAVTCLPIPGAFSADYWPYFSGPDRLATSSETGLKLSFGNKAPPVLWSLDLNEGFGGAGDCG